MPRKYTVFCIAELWRERDEENPRDDQSNCPQTGRFYTALNETKDGYYELEEFPRAKWHKSGFHKTQQEPYGEKYLTSLEQSFPKPMNV